jgi:hypothetical protein
MKGAASLREVSEEPTLSLWGQHPIVPKMSLVLIMVL